MRCPTARLLALLLSALCLSPLRAQTTGEADPVGPALQRLEKGIQRAEELAQKIATKREQAARSDLEAKDLRRQRDEAVARAEADASRIERVERQLEDQNKAHARALLEMQKQLDELRTTLQARAENAERERDAARQEAAELVSAQRRLLDAVRAHREAVSALVRELRRGAPGNDEAQAGKPAPSSTRAK